MRRYKRLIRSATGSSFAPLGNSINRKASTTAVTKAVINCFGLPTVSAEKALEALKTNVWSTLGSNVALALADGFHLVGILGTVAAGGIPAWLVTGAINTSYVVPATCRVFLIMACDLTLVLARSFKEVTFRARTQPNEKDVSAAARNYRIRGYSQHVHREIKQLVPRRNVIASFKADQVRQGIEAIIARHKDKLMEDVDLPLNVDGMSIGSKDSDDRSISTEADSTLFSDLKQANDAVAELEANSPVAELDATRIVAELPASEKKLSELEDSAGTRKKYELEG